MKNWFLYLIFIFVITFGFYPSVAQAAIFEMDVPPTGVLGEEVKIVFRLEGEFSSSPDHISVFILQPGAMIDVSSPEAVCNSANHPPSALHLKGMVKIQKQQNNKDPGPSKIKIEETFGWQTTKQNTVPGSHTIYAVLMNSSSDKACEPASVVQPFSLAVRQAQIFLGSSTTTSPSPTSSATPGSGGGAQNTVPEIKFPSLVLKPPVGSKGESRVELAPDNFIRALIRNVIVRLLEISGGLAILALIYSGILYITSGGQPPKAEMGKRNLTWALIGVVVIILGLLIINTIPTIVNK